MTDTDNPQPPEPPKTPLERLTEIRDILLRIDKKQPDKVDTGDKADKAADRKKGDTTPKKKTDDKPGFVSGLKDFVASLRSLFSAGGIGQFLSGAKGVFSGANEAGQAATNTVFGSARKEETDTSTKKTKTKKEEEDKSEKKSFSSKVKDVTSRVFRGMFQRGGGIGQGAAGDAGSAAASGVARGGAVAGRGAGMAAQGAGRLLPMLGAIAGPFAAVAAGAGAVVAAFVALPFIAKSFGESLLNAQKHLAEVSGSMAAVFANKEVSDTMRNQRIGEATAGSAGGLSDALIKLEDRFEPFQVLITNFLNDVMTDFISFATSVADAIISGINKIIDGLNFIIRNSPGSMKELQQIRINTTPKSSDTDLGNVLREWGGAANKTRSGPARAGNAPVNPGFAF